jgi:hypothetical protein
VAFLSLRHIRDSDLGTVFAAVGGQRRSGPAPGPGDTGPESLADPAHVRRLLTGAGLTDVTSTPVDAAQVWGRDAEDAAAFVGAWGPVRFALDQMSPALASRARDALTTALRSFEQDGAVRLRGAAWLITATRP